MVPNLFLGNDQRRVSLDYNPLLYALYYLMHSEQMANIKTAISLQKALFEQVEDLAHEMKVSRSRLFVLALENFIREYQDRQLFDKINKAYESAPPDETEQNRLQQIRRQHKRTVEGEW